MMLFLLVSFIRNNLHEIADSYFLWRQNVVIMKPGLIRSKKMDLIILPRHDVNGEIRRNMLITDGAPNRITQKTMEEAIVRLQGDRGIGLLIGGDAKGFKLKKEDVEKVINEIIKISEENNLDIFVSTSRRTSQEIDRLLKEKLNNNKRCKLLVIANEKNTEGTVADIFRLSDIIVLSPESMSMISEAASSGKYVMVFRSRVKNTKYNKMASNLEKNGYIYIAQPDEIFDKVKEILKTRPGIKKLEDREKITERLKALI